MVGDTGKTCYANTSGTSICVDESDEDTEVQYLVKWMGWSHLHNTWETGAFTRVVGVVMICTCRDNAG